MQFTAEIPSPKRITVRIFAFTNGQMFSRPTPPLGQNIHSQRITRPQIWGFWWENRRTGLLSPTLPSPKPPPGFLGSSRHANSAGSDSSRSLNRQEHQEGRAWPPSTQGPHPAGRRSQCRVQPGPLPSRPSSSSDRPLQVALLLTFSIWYEDFRKAQEGIHKYNRTTESCLLT